MGKKMHCIQKFNLPNFATNCTIILSPAIAHLTSKAVESCNTSQFSFDCKKSENAIFDTTDRDSL